MQVVNIGLDCSVGLVPIVGTVIDTYFKANLANLGILENHIRKTPKWVTSCSCTPLSSLTKTDTHIWLFQHLEVGGKLGKDAGLLHGHRKIGILDTTTGVEEWWLCALY